MKILSIEQIIQIHEKILEESGGCFGIRDENLLTSAINSPLQTFNGTSLYKTNLEKITRISYGIARNHSFLDGNKRIAAIVLLTLLEINQFNFEITDEDLIDVFINVGSGVLSYEEFLEYIRQNLKK